MTYDERMEKRAAQRQKAEERRRIAEMHSAEHRLAGPMDNQKGKKRGPYNVGGPSTRTAQEKRKKLKEAFERGKLQISKAEYERQMAALQPKPPNPARKQQTIGDMFKKRARAISVSSDEVVEVSPPPSPAIPAAKRHKADNNSMSAGLLASVDLREEEEESSDSGDQMLANEMELADEDETSLELLEIEARLAEGSAVIESIAKADEIAEWVDTVLDDAAPLEPMQLEFLAADCLRKSRKSKDFWSTVLFAALVDFYRWMPLLGRLRAALRVAKNHGRGPAFQRVICAQARFFEANGALKPTHQGQGQKPNSLLDDEGFYMGVQRWLRTLAIGTWWGRHDGGEEEVDGGSHGGGTAWGVGSAEADSAHGTPTIIPPLIKISQTQHLSHHGQKVVRLEDIKGPPAFPVKNISFARTRRGDATKAAVLDYRQSPVRDNATSFLPSPHHTGTFIEMASSTAALLERARQRRLRQENQTPATASSPVLAPLDLNSSPNPFGIGGAYILCELDGSVFHRPIAAFRVIPYFSRTSITLPALDEFLDVDTERLRELEQSTLTDPDELEFDLSELPGSPSSTGDHP
ncbi:hypothetical protein B0H14DRAFT_3637989 [Mycena olivaceomarginata]|nr:hypothetical protein B0H14DRAFT_3637989 [Mycena olivaceomarginata]